MEHLTLKLINTARVLATLKLRNDSVDVRCDLTSNGVAGLFRSDIVEVRACISINSLTTISNTLFGNMDYTEWRTGLPVHVEGSNEFRQHALLFASARDNSSDNAARFRELADWLSSHELCLVAQTGSDAYPVNVLLLPRSATLGTRKLKSCNSQLHCVFLRPIEGALHADCIGADTLRDLHLDIYHRRLDLSARDQVCNLQVDSEQLQMKDAFKQHFTLQRKTSLRMDFLRLIDLLYAELECTVSADSSSEFNPIGNQFVQSSARLSPLDGLEQRNPDLLCNSLHQRVTLTTFCSSVRAVDVHRRLPRMVQVLLREVQTHRDSLGKLPLSAVSQYLVELGRLQVRSDAQVTSFDDISGRKAWQFAVSLPKNQSTSQPSASVKVTTQSGQEVAENKGKLERFTAAIMRKISAKLRARNLPVTRLMAVRLFQRSKLHAIMVRRYGEPYVKQRVLNAIKLCDINQPNLRRMGLRRMATAKQEPTESASPAGAADLKTVPLVKPEACVESAAQTNEPILRQHVTEILQLMTAAKVKITANDVIDELAKRTGLSSVKMRCVAQLIVRAGYRIIGGQYVHVECNTASGAQAPASLQRKAETPAQLRDKRITCVAGELAASGKLVTTNSIREVFKERYGLLPHRCKLKRALVDAGYLYEVRKRRYCYYKARDARPDVLDSQLRKSMRERLHRQIVQVAEELTASGAPAAHHAIRERLTTRGCNAHQISIYRALTANGYRLLPHPKNVPGYYVRDNTTGVVRAVRKLVADACNTVSNAKKRHRTGASEEVAHKRRKMTSNPPKAKAGDAVQAYSTAKHKGALRGAV